MQRIKTSRILMLRIKPVVKLKSSCEKPAIRYVKFKGMYVANNLCMHTTLLRTMVHNNSYVYLYVCTYSM